MVLNDNRHRDENANPRAAAQRVDGWGRFIRDADAKHGAVVSAEGVGNLGDMRERQADFPATGDHRARRIQEPKSRQRRNLRAGQDRSKPSPDVGDGSMGGRRRRARIRTSGKDVVASEIERRLDRPVWLRTQCRIGRNGGAEERG